jgi:hypothetical protein
MAVRPIFLFSISRSGSTLLQRILASHRGIATVSEPWLLLPHAYTLRPRGVDAEYVHPLLVAAIEDFCEQLPGGREEYRDRMRRFALELYERAAGDAAYFLDKSPPYCLIAAEIIEIFPEAKFVFLWRNPLSVMSSMIETWGPWHPNLMSSDLFIGLPRLIAAYEANRTRSHAVRFEDLVGGDETAWGALMEYLDIEFEPRALEEFSKVELKGRMGDPTGRHRYLSLSDEPAQKWPRTLANPLRREWARRYLRFLGPQRLGTMGYDQESLLADVNALQFSLDSFAPDLWRSLKDVLKEPIRARTSRKQIGTGSVIRQLITA